MGAEVDIFSKALQAGGLGLAALLIWVLYRTFQPWVAAKIEGEKTESKARVEALQIISATTKEASIAFQMHEVSAERRHGALLLHVAKAAEETQKDIRNALTMVVNGESPERKEYQRDREGTDPGRRRPR